MDDLISRQAAIDAVDGVDWYHINKSGEMVQGANPDDHQAWYKAEDIYKAIESVPSAQPTGEDIQRMQDIEQAMLEKAYWIEIGDIGKLRSLRAAGWPLKKLAEEFNCSEATVYNTMKREGIE